MLKYIQFRPVENAIGFDPGCTLWRRYSEFEILRNYLMAIYPYVSIIVFFINAFKLQNYFVSKQKCMEYDISIVGLLYGQIHSINFYSPP